MSGRYFRRGSVKSMFLVTLNLNERMNGEIMKWRELMRINQNEGKELLDKFA